ncbi:D-alanyl-D-alanine carboxypeptidase/D-alanyl-D-alanine endopeptidase [Quadrisphaera setariae]|uniref:D-alanyl-D-alanine carboxypeptidase/D-alanyl-D-alanine-endopeptidase n=1 Tax=Quadrisphaera setariae TaxID=2593304 RepID=A0A5C8Z5Z0_9ACTN|nr:D-alanyl-D-alanine carboxypeptidase/D-alanyl-D-alanine-endopeptidase [Quadrisphaera setariae]TXR52350.1 D-alanyl-D-alanine carboxypeptidase/D-alanyl-D-alanine-endopeptidase [Quadrisphaera setariae]
MAGPPERTPEPVAQDDDAPREPAPADPAPPPAEPAPPAPAGPPSPPVQRSARRRGLRVGATAAALALLLGGYAVADAAGAAPGVLTLAPVPTAPAPAVPPGAAARPAPPEALAGLDPSAPRPDPTALAAALGPLLAAPALRGSATASVVDATTGQVLLDSGASQPQEPASVAKLLTATAVLHALGPDATLPTRVVAGAAPGQLVLVGGGDQLLTAGRSDPGATVGRAGLADLADAVAASLRARGTTSATVVLDDSLTGGSPQVEAGWGSGDIAAGYVAPLTSVALDAGRATPANYAPRSLDPGLDVARTLASLLAQRGVQVDPAAVVRGGPAPAGSAVLGEVRSAPLVDVVADALAESDNTVAEALARLVGAAAGRPPGFAASAQAVLEEASAAGVDTTGAVLVDGSGLGAGSQVPAAVFTSVLSTAARQPQAAPLLEAMPVGGLSGTLAERFAGGSAGAAGLVRAKTGSLTGVSSLVGTVVDADGRLLAFAVLADGTGPTVPARQSLDAVAAALAGCGCRTG